MRDSSAFRAKGLNWAQVRILYWREIRAALREKTIVVNSILIPIFLYPFLLWAALSGLMFVMGQTEGFLSRVAMREWPKGHPVLRNKFKTNQHLQLAESQDSDRALERKINAGDLDLVLDFAPASQARAALAGNFEVRLIYNQSKERSMEARNRVTDLIGQYRADWLKREGRRLGMDAASWAGFTISSHNVASKKEMGAFILGLLAPVIFVIMVAMGCFYPAVDAVAGERERNTWETLMSSAASRLSIVVAKYLYVASFGALAGLLNLLAVILTVRPIFAPLLARTGRLFECNIPLAAIPVAFIAGILLAGFIAAGMMIFASFARTFKEGQAMVTPFYLLVLVPVVFLQAPGLKFSVGLAFLPVVNVTLMVREAFAGHFLWLPSLLAVVVSLIVIAAWIRVAGFILQFEDVVLGSYSGSFNKFLRERILRRNAAATLKTNS